jgi:hypothetical protein
MNEKPLGTPAPTHPDSAGTQQPADARPIYEPPRVVKKRSVARATLATGTGPMMGGVVAQG